MIKTYRWEDLEAGQYFYFVMGRTLYMVVGHPTDKDTKYYVNFDTNELNWNRTRSDVILAVPGRGYDEAYKDAEIDLEMEVRSKLEKHLTDEELEWFKENYRLTDNENYRTTMFVPSDSDSSKKYKVTETYKGRWECSCPDYQYRKKGTWQVCKHIRRIW